MAAGKEEITAARLGACYTAIGVVLAAISFAAQHSSIHFLQAIVEPGLVIGAMFLVAGFVQAFRGRAARLGKIAMAAAGALLLLACVHTVMRALAGR